MPPLGTSDGLVPPTLPNSQRVRETTQRHELPCSPSPPVGAKQSVPLGIQVAHEDAMTNSTIHERGTSPRARALRLSLEQQRTAIHQAIHDRLKNASEVAPDNAHIDGAMLSDVVDDVDYALVALQAETLEHIEDALERLDEGEYGLCLDCGKEIPARRLEALPFAVRCRPCEDANEQRHQPRPAGVAIHRPAFLG